MWVWAKFRAQSPPLGQIKHLTYSDQLTIIIDIKPENKQHAFVVKKRQSLECLLLWSKKGPRKKVIQVWNATSMNKR